MNLFKKIRDAIAYADKKNGSKTRKDGLRGSTHALIVATIVSEYEPTDESAIITAILHDVFPNLKVYEHVELLEKFGPQVNDWLVQLSDKFIGNPAEDLEGIPWKAEKIIRLAWLREAAEDRLLLIYFADKLHNIISTNDLIEMHGAERAFTLFDTRPEAMLWLDEERLKIFAGKGFYPVLYHRYLDQFEILRKYVAMYNHQKIGQ